MNLLPTLSLAGATTGLCLALSAHAVSGIPHTPSGPPLATLDLTTREGVQAVKGEWRYSDTRIIEIEHRRPDKDGQPTGERIKTYDYAPHAGGIDFDDTKWPVLDPTTLSQRRCRGRLCFNWYRIKLTIPQRIGTIDPAGTTAVLETSVDDYAEIWVDGELPRASGQSGGSVISGWNAPNRLVIGRGVRPGQPIQIAIFGINGPISDPPANFIWMRTAKLDFYPTDQPDPAAVVPQEVNVEVVMRDPALAAIVPANPKIFKLAEGFQFTEGPIWMHAGYLLFSDPNSNTIYKYVPDDQVSVFREHSGYDGKDIAMYGQPGSNGLTLDREGRLTINEHGNHRVTRLEKDGRSVVLLHRSALRAPQGLRRSAQGASL